MSSEVWSFGPGQSGSTLHVYTVKSWDLLKGASGKSIILILRCTKALFRVHNCLQKCDSFIIIKVLK